MISSDKYFSDIEVENGDVSAFKNNTIAFGYALPGWKEALTVDILRVILSGFIFGNMSMIIYSLAGAALSFAVMLAVAFFQGTEEHILMSRLNPYGEMIRKMYI